MKSRLILLAAFVAVGFTSCSVYRSGQTPDDVYYSPGQDQKAAGGSGGDDYVNVRERQSSRYNSRNNDTYYDDYYPDDAYLRMRVRNPYRWSMFDNYWNDYGYGGYGSGLSFGYGGFYGGMYNPWYNSFYNPWYGYTGWNHGWNNYYYWNNYYNPYCGGGVIIVNPKTNPGAYSRVRNFNMNTYTGSYNNRNNYINNGKGSRSSYTMPSGISVYNNSNRASSGNAGRNTYYNTNRSNGNGRYNGGGGYDRPVRSYNPPVSPSTNNSGGSFGRGSSGGGSTGGGGGPVSRPSRN